jgi:hypothetical protein
MDLSKSFTLGEPVWVGEGAESDGYPHSREGGRVLGQH